MVEDRPTHSGSETLPKESVFSRISFMAIFTGSPTARALNCSAVLFLAKIGHIISCYLETVQYRRYGTIEVAYGLSIGTKIGDLE